MFDEENFIINSFNNNFRDFVDVPLAIYGLGKNSKAVLEQCSDFCIVGLMDSVRTGETVWGKQVLSIEEIIKKEVKVIVIIAIAANVPIIYRRIAVACKKNDICVYDINGNRLERKTQRYVLAEKYAPMKEEALKAAIDMADVVSFDIFDTLLVRNTLIPTDIFENVCSKHKDLFPQEYHYIKNRISAEHRLYINSNPTIDGIYQEMQSDEISSTCLESMKTFEIEEEEQALTARKAMISIVNYALIQGKIICCTSDMYLTSDILEKLLRNAGYPDFDAILVSCEQGCSKSSGLYQVLRRRYHEATILHIGDNTISDVEMPLRYGIDQAYPISSVYQMLEDSCISEILDCGNELRNRNFLGKMFSDIFNNPFCLSKTHGKCNICSEYILGYFYLEPMIRVFVEWMISTCKAHQIEHVLLASRDGWLIQKLLDIRNEMESVGFTHEYFYASRSACTLAGMESEEDVLYVSTMAFDGSMENMLKKRFLLENDQILERKHNESNQEYLLRHVNTILSNADQYRKAYRGYALSLSGAKKKTGFFDFVSSGTCQLWLEKILGISLHGLYFIRNPDEYKDRLTVYSMYEPRCVYEKQSKMYDNYIFMENILTSPEPSLKYISSVKGRIWEEEKRTEKEIRSLKEIHRGIIDAYKEELSKKIPSVSLELAENLLNLIRTEYSFSDIDFLKNGTLYDEFCNRSYEISNTIGGN